MCYTTPNHSRIKQLHNIPPGFAILFIKLYPGHAQASPPKKLKGEKSTEPGITSSNWSKALWIGALLVHTNDHLSSCQCKNVQDWKYWSIKTILTVEQNFICKVKWKLVLKVSRNTNFNLKIGGVVIRFREQQMQVFLVTVWRQKETICIKTLHSSALIYCSKDDYNGAVYNTNIVQVYVFVAEIRCKVNYIHVCNGYISWTISNRILLHIPYVTCNTNPKLSLKECCGRVVNSLMFPLSLAFPYKASHITALMRKKAILHILSTNKYICT